MSDEILKLRADGLEALDVEVKDSTDASFIDIVVSNRRGEVASVTLEILDGNLVLHAEDRTTPHAPGTLDPACVIGRDVIVENVFDAVPLEADAERPLRDQRGRPGLTAGQLAAARGGEKVMCPACGHGAVTAYELRGVWYVEHKHPTCDFVQEMPPPAAPPVACPRCGAEVWDRATADQRLNKCWGCGLRFDNGEGVADDAS